MISKDELSRFDPSIKGVYIDKRSPRFVHLTIEPDTICVSFTKAELERLIKEIGDEED